MIELKAEHFIGKGKERLCYQHPNHENLCIKISQKSRNRKYEENEKEFSYFNKHLKGSSNLPISEPVDWVQTNLGRGLTFQLIRDHDGSISKDLKTLIAQNQLSYDDAIIGMEQLKQEFCEKMISVIDLNLGNLLLQKISDDEHRLIMIDGFGIKNMIPVLYLSKFLGRKEITRRFDRYIKELMKQLEPSLQPA